MPSGDVRERNAALMSWSKEVAITCGTLSTNFATFVAMCMNKAEERYAYRRQNPGVRLPSVGQLPGKWAEYNTMLRHLLLNAVPETI